MKSNVSISSWSLNLVIALAVVLAVTPAFSADQDEVCKDETLILSNRQKEVEPPLGPFDKAFVIESNGGVYREERLCSPETELPVSSKFYMFGKLHGVLHTSDGWSGRDLELYDDEGRLRVIKTNVTFDFARVLYFDAKGQLVDQTKLRTFGTSDILQLYEHGELPDAVVLLWLLHYHGEGGDTSFALANWLLSNRDKALVMMKRLDRDRDMLLALARVAVNGLGDHKLNDGTTQQSRFRAMFKLGDSVTTDEMIHTLNQIDEIVAGPNDTKP